jgi:hypothetical protein
MPAVERPSPPRQAPAVAQPAPRRLPKSAPRAPRNLLAIAAASLLVLPGLPLGAAAFAAAATSSARGR